MAELLTVNMASGEGFTTKRHWEDGSEMLVSLGWFVEAWTPEGRRFGHEHAFPTLEAAERFISRVRMARADRKAVIDVSKACWSEGDPIYGSELYQRLGCEEAWSNRERAEANW